MDSSTSWMQRRCFWLRLQVWGRVYTSLALRDIDLPRGLINIGRSYYEAPRCWWSMNALIRIVHLMMLFPRLLQILSYLFLNTEWTWRFFRLNDKPRLMGKASSAPEYVMPCVAPCSEPRRSSQRVFRVETWSRFTEADIFPGISGKPSPKYRSWMSTTFKPSVCNRS